jgi:hypothetical protein
VTGFLFCLLLLKFSVYFIFQDILEDTIYRLQASGIYKKFTDDLLDAPAEIPLARVHVNKENNLPILKLQFLPSE